MTLHRESQYSTEIMLILGMIGGGVLLAGATMIWVSGSSTRGDPVVAIATQGPALVQEADQLAETIPWTMTTSPRGDYRFMAPTAWSHPVDSRDRALEAFFVGPVDAARRTVVMISVSRYSRSAHAGSVDQLVAQLDTDQTKHVLGVETIAVDRRPARLVRTHEVTSMLSKGLEVLSLDLTGSIILVESGPDLLVLEYVASRDLYGEYRPIFDRFVTSFQFVSTP